MKEIEKNKNYTVITSKISVSISAFKISKENPNKIILTENVKKLIEVLDIYDYEFAIKCKISRKRLSEIITGRYMLTSTVIFKILKQYPLLNLNWLFTGNGKIWLANNK